MWSAARATRRSAVQPHTPARPCVRSTPHRLGHSSQCLYALNVASMSQDSSRLWWRRTDEGRSRCIGDVTNVRNCVQFGQVYAKKELSARNWRENVRNCVHIVQVYAVSDVCEQDGRENLRICVQFVQMYAKRELCDWNGREKVRICVQLLQAYAVSDVYCPRRPRRPRRRDSPRRYASKMW